MIDIVSALLGVGCFLYFLELLTGPWFGDKTPPEEIYQIQLDLLLSQEDLSIKSNRVICNECQRESCGFCNNGEVIQQAQNLLDVINEV
jgi:hypothetical protein